MPEPTSAPHAEPPFASAHLLARSVKYVILTPSSWQLLPVRDVLYPVSQAANRDAGSQSDRFRRPDQRNHLERSLLPDAARMATGAATPQVVVVGEDPETVDGLQAYFADVGISARAAHSLDAANKVPAPTTAFVVFPDGFRAAE